MYIGVVWFLIPHIQNILFLSVIMFKKHYLFIIIIKPWKVKMADNNNALLIVVGIILAALTIVSIIVESGNGVDEEALSDRITAQVISQIDVPTAVEIAAEIPAVEIPEVPAPKDLNNNRIDDLWEDLYEDDIDELEAEAYDVAEVELEDNDYELLTEWLEANIEGFDELEDVDVDDYEITVIELGLEEDEDKVVEIVFELEIEYSLQEGVAQDYKKDMIATASVSFDEGDFSDEDVELVFA